MPTPYTYKPDHTVRFPNGDEDSCPCAIGADHSADAPGSPWVEDPYEWAGFM